MKDPDIFKDAQWIWLPKENEEVNQYVCFRKNFTIEEIDSRASLYISADTDFIVYVNGIEAGRGQFPDYPIDKTYSVFPVGKMLKKGLNTVAVLAYYCGENFSTYRKGEPGIIAVFKSDSAAICSTDQEWKCVRHPAFTSGTVPKVTGQLGFTVTFNARKYDREWISFSFDDSSWKNAVVRNESERTLSPRPLPSLVHLERIPMEIVMQGELKRTGEYETAAVTSSKDMLVTTAYSDDHVFNKLSEADSNGYFVIVDLKELTVGMIEISVEAPAGTVLDILHGEHLDDGRVRCNVGVRNFTDRYICSDGLNEFVFPFRRAGCKYIEVHFTKSGNDPIKINYIGMRPVAFPLPDDQLFFESNDPLADKLHSTAVRTLRMCMHDHYEDCPWREQALYAYDSRNQALYGYYLWGNYDFAKTSIDLLGKGMRDDGLLELCAPAKVAVTIPIFSFVWISEIYEHYLHSGSMELFEKYADTIRTIIGKAASDHDTATGLYVLGKDKSFWHFYEWTEGLSGEKNSSGKEELHCCYNIYFYEALCSFAKLLKAAGKMDEATETGKRAAGLAASINTAFWDTENNCYSTKIIDGVKSGKHEHVQAVALYNNLADNEKITMILEHFRSGKMVPISLSSMVYMLKAFMELGAEERKFMAVTIAKSFERIVMSGSSTLWETLKGAKDFGGAGSLCHGWSSLPAYYYNSYVLGVTPLDAGFKKFRIAPYPDRFYRVKGRISTPEGDIEVEWKRVADNRLIWQARGPEGLEPLLQPYPETEILSASYNAIKLI